MVEVLLFLHRTQRNGLPQISEKKPLEYTRGMKKINCKIDIAVRYLAGISWSQKRIEELESIGIKTIEDFISAPVQKFDCFHQKFKNQLLAVHEKLLSKKIVAEESFKKGKRGILSYLKALIEIRHLNTEEKAVLAGLAVFAPLLKVTRQSLVGFKSQLPFFKEGDDFQSKIKKKVFKIEIRKQRKIA